VGWEGTCSSATCTGDGMEGAWAAGAMVHGQEVPAGDMVPQCKPPSGRRWEGALCPKILRGRVETMADQGGREWPLMSFHC